MSLEELCQLRECLHKGRVAPETWDQVCGVPLCTRRVAEAGEFQLYVWGRLLGVKVKHGEEVEQLLSWGAQWGNLSPHRC